jgi:phosphatidylglycerol lysyltransferase
MTASGQQTAAAGSDWAARLRGARAVLTAISPALSSFLLFLGGGMALLAAATPQLAKRLDILAEIAPLGLIELSHFVGSILATLMLFLAYGVSRRLEVARRAAMVLCFASAALAMAYGLVWEEGLYLVAIGLLLWATKGAYYRRSKLSEIRPGAWWVAAIVAALALTAWIGFAAYEHIPYSGDLWWTFLLDADVSRFLRALTGVAIVAALILLWRYAGATHPKPDAADGARAIALLGGQAQMAPEAWLGATGDKHFLFSDTGASMIMYAPEGGAWIAMGGPVGPLAERREMIWRFREKADVANAWTAFYSVGPDLLPDMLDAGLVLQKVGETAIVPLQAFSLDGGTRARLRQTRARAGRDGFVFAVERPAAISPLMVELKAVSDAWLKHHNGAEKRFSLGRFDEDYLARFPVGVLRRNGVVEAFANVWTGGAGGDVAIDLMRVKPDIPKGAMDVLFIELLLWAKAEGYRRFDLGMAPLSGLESRRFAPWLSRAGALVYRYGGRIYGFEGLREFKSKFDPAWEPRYLAAPAGWRLSAALGRVALLTSGGLTGMMRR